MPKSLPAWLTAVVLPLALASVGCGDATHDEAESAAKAWVAQHADGWEVQVTKESGVTFDHSTCINGLVLVWASTPKAHITLSFDCPGNEVVDLAWLRAHARGYDLLLKIPIDAPGWTFDASSPTSSFTEGMTFESWQSSDLATRLETPMFAVRGETHSPACGEAGGDGPASDDCWVNVPWEGTAVVHMDVPLVSDWLRMPPPVRQ